MESHFSKQFMIPIQRSFKIVVNAAAPRSGARFGVASTYAVTMARSAESASPEFRLSNQVVNSAVSVSDIPSTMARIVPRIRPTL